MVAGVRGARRRGAFRGCRRDVDADSLETSADASPLDGPEVVAGELALDEDLWEAAALVGRRRAGRISSSLSAARAAFNVWISSFSSWSRLSIDSTISWVVCMLLMLRTYVARPLTAGAGASRRGTAPRREPDRLESPDLLAGPAVVRYRLHDQRIPVRASRTVNGARRGSLGGGAQSIWRRSAPITGVPDHGGEAPTRVRRRCHDELAAYCRARRNG